MYIFHTISDILDMMVIERYREEEEMQDSYDNDHTGMSE